MARHITEGVAMRVLGASAIAGALVTLEASVAQADGRVREVR